MDIFEKSREYHKINKGKIEIKSRSEIISKDDLSIVYTPGVAGPCLEIALNEDNVYDYTCKSRMVAVVSDGSAVLGLGNIGAKAAIPVMEGKALLFKKFGDVDAVPICLDTQNVDDIINTVKNIAPAFGGINLEDISAPRCFEIERRLIEELDIPIFHDDQHGTAIVVCAGLINALKIVNKTFENIKVVVNGAGSAGISISRLLMKFGVKNIILVDKNGVVNKDEKWLNNEQMEIAKISNPECIKGNLKDVIVGCDVFIGVSCQGALPKDYIKFMNNDAIVFAMANPIPEILPEEALEAGVRIIATGRSDYPNQINNVLVFPGIFKGALDGRVRYIDDKVKVEVSKAIASVIKDGELKEDYIIPSVFNEDVVKAVSLAVKNANNK